MVDEGVGEPEHSTSRAPVQRFGTFLGVFTPSVLTILGVMMYLRFGWVVGNLGLPLAALTVLGASAITFVTGLSASAVATNMRVGVGGEYFMVSRSLGLELGGAIGIPLFLCRTLSLTLYAFGLAESIAFLWPTRWGEAPVPWMAAAIIVLTVAIAGKSAALSLKLQIPIMVSVGLSILALTMGILIGGGRTPELEATYRTTDGDFWYVFAVFFPAVTGFTAGIGMSGDLEDPKRSIPRGTLLAVVTGTATYVLIMVLLATTARVGAAELAVLDPTAPPIWTRIAVLGPVFVFPGMWGAILSSAFGSALGGPRVLQALANDGLAPRVLGRTSATGQPQVATWVTGAIALCAVALGDLNAVGRWVTIFFLTLYVTINLAAGVERLVGDISYRPTLRVPWYVSIGGSVGAIVVMFLIHRVACVAAVAFELLLYLHLRRRALRSAWGDVRAGLWTALARLSLLQLRGRTEQARNWRPHILLFTANPASRIDLVRLASWFNQNRGVVTVCQMLEGDLRDLDADIELLRRDLQATLDSAGLVAFGEVSVVPRLDDGLLAIAQANGFAGMQSNTLMFGWPNSREGVAKLLRVMRAVSLVQKNVVLARLPRHDQRLQRDRIDVWWRGRQHNGDLMILLAYLLNLNPEWRRARVTVRTIVTRDEERTPLKQALSQLIAEARIAAETDVVVQPPDMPVDEVMRRASLDADVVFLGLGMPEAGQEQAYADRLLELAPLFRATVFVRNNGPFRGNLL